MQVNYDRDEGHKEEVMPGSETLRRVKKNVLGYYIYSGRQGGENEHVFCKICGSSLWIDTKGGEEMAKETRKEGEEDIVTVNVSCFSFRCFSLLFCFVAFRESREE